MDKQAILTGKKLSLNKPDRDYLKFENQSGEWSVRTQESFEKHLNKLKILGSQEGFWYGKPERAKNEK